MCSLDMTVTVLSDAPECCLPLCCMIVCQGHLRVGPVLNPVGNCRAELKWYIKLQIWHGESAPKVLLGLSIVFYKTVLCVNGFS